MFSDRKDEIPSTSVAIVGAGIAGIITAVALNRQLGFEDYIILEKASDIGGTWRDNIYPGCGSDVPVHFYSLSTDLNPYWEYSHGSSAELKKYWDGIVGKYSIRPHVTFYTKVLRAEWDAVSERYLVTTQNVRTGDTKHLWAKVFISAIGLLEEPRFPDIAGISTFKGHMFHSAQWNYGVDLRGKRVAVIGNGASAGQLIPCISEDPTTTVVNFCRSPNWCAQRAYVPLSDRARWIFAHIPLAMRMYRNSIYARSDLLWVLFQNELWSNLARKYFTKWMLKTAPKEYHDKIIPSFSPGCRRIILDTGYLASFHRSNLSMNWDGIQAITEGGIVTGTGENMPFDVVVLATGYTANEFLLPVSGTGGQTLQGYSAAHGGPQAYMATTVPGFPNFCVIAGPNVATGHTSYVFSEEVQIDYTIQLLRPILRGELSTFEPLPEATEAYNALLQRKLATTVFTQCASWYQRGGTGRNCSIFPGPVTLFWWYLRTVDWRAYKVAGKGGTSAAWWRWRRWTAALVRRLGVVMLVGLGVGAWLRPEVRVLLAGGAQNTLHWGQSATRAARGLLKA